MCSCSVRNFPLVCRPLLLLAVSDVDACVDAAAAAAAAAAANNVVIAAAAAAAAVVAAVGVVASTCSGFVANCRLLIVVCSVDFKVGDGDLGILIGSIGRERRRNGGTHAEPGAVDNPAACTMP